MDIKKSEKFGLWWSKYDVLDKDWNVIASNDYLYMPERFSECFWILFERLHHTHDYCLHQLIESQNKLEELIEETKENPDSEGHYYWEYNVDVVSKSTVLVVMASFIEWGLKKVLKELTGSIPSRTNKSISNIEHYISGIQNLALNDLKLSQELSFKLEMLRKLRNKFAHGDWDQIEEILKEIRFKDTFKAISDLFEEIEQLAWSSPWGEA